MSRTRRVLFLLGLPPLVVALALALKVATMLHLNASGRHAYADGRLTGATAAFQSTLTANLLEEWVAPYDVGTALLREKDYETARSRLRDALALAPEAEECRVRINLALADEALGDSALADGDVGEAREGWSTARQDLAAGDCTDDYPAVPHEQMVSALAIEGRLRGKLDTTQDTGAAPAPQPDQAATSLDERNQRAERRRHRDEERREERRHRPKPHGPASPPPTYEW